MAIGYRREQKRAYIHIGTHNILHQVCTTWVIHHMMQNIIYLVLLHHCTTAGRALEKVQDMAYGYNGSLTGSHR